MAPRRPITVNISHGPSRFTRLTIFVSVLVIIVASVSWLLASGGNGNGGNAQGSDKSTASPSMTSAPPQPIAAVLDAKKATTLGQPSGPPNANAVYAFDATTGTELYAKNADASMPIASITKLMTIELVEKKIAAHQGTWDDVVTATKQSNLVNMSKAYDVGGFVFFPTTTYTVRDLVEAALIKSSNNAAIALGIWVAGSNTAFVHEMNTEAARLGLTQSHFIGASGLDRSDLAPFGLVVPGMEKTESGTSSARDVVALSNYLIKTYPSILSITSQTSMLVHNQRLRTTNYLLPGQPDADPALPVDGLKTGDTGAAGSCFVATVQPAGKDRIIVVELHDNGPNRYTDMRTFLRGLYAWTGGKG